MQSEEWRDIPGREGRYQASSHGRIRSLDRSIITSAGVIRRLKGKILKPQIRDDFYYSVSLEASKVSERVHVLVASAFLGPCKEGFLVRHRDDDGYNNIPSNLCYGSGKDNSDDSEKLAIKFNRKQRHDGVVFPDQVSAIKALKGTISQRMIAYAFGVSRGCVTGIHNGKNWPNVTPCDIKTAKAVMQESLNKDRKLMSGYKHSLVR